MTFIFWQRTLDILHSSFLRNLAEIYSVVLVTEIGMDATRNKHGFYIPDFWKVKIIVAPNKEQIAKLSETEAVHIVSGVWSFKLSKQVLRHLVKKQKTIGIFSEPFNWMGIKGEMRIVKYWLFRLSCGSSIRFILVTGERGRWCYEKIRFPKSKIFDWAYFTETPAITIKQDMLSTPKILFIGSIDKRKNILTLVDICMKTGVIDNLTIIGVGPLEATLRKKIKGTQCKYLGRIPNKEVHQIIADSDVLILPSLYDGWGAVVNEALMCGIPVIASNNCGSSILVQGERGRVFSIKNNDLKKVISDFVRELPYSVDKRENIRNWALQNISGETAVKYFNEIMEHVFFITAQRPMAPWLSEEY